MERKMDLMRLLREKERVEKGLDICPICYWVDHKEVKLVRIDKYNQRCPVCKMTFAVLYLLPPEVRKQPRPEDVK